MSLDERFRTALNDAISEVRTRLETDFAAVLADARAEADREKAAALDAAEEAVTAAVSDARSRLQAELLQAYEADKAALVASHEQLLAQAADAARHDATRLAESAAADLERHRVDAAATIEAVRSELRDAQATLLQSRDDHESQVARLRSESDAQVQLLQSGNAATTTQLHTDFDARTTQLQAEHDTLVAQLRDEIATLTRQRDEFQEQSVTARAEGESFASGLRDEHEATQARLQQAADQALAAARAEAQHAADAAITAAHHEARHAADLHGQALDAHQTSSLRLLGAVRALDGATSLTEVLDALATGAAKEAGRAAMLVVKGDRLVGWRTIGFGAWDHEARTLESSTGDVGALAAAVNTGRAAVVGSGSVLVAPSFSDAPADRPGLAVPLLVGGKPVAVVYADPGAAAAPIAWTSSVEVLVRHAARCLEGLAVQRASVARPAPARVGAPA